ncbi:uncharacterized protein [Triticum aestivum]|uniref:uncharacterized protein isoform X1 n=1 Tax=Triticum aestivum TaxID=4565 RepID=UPI001D005692|nr:uncharacterized protein LOC123069450 isoform X1 [Triticum aestivum]
MNTRAQMAMKSLKQHRRNQNGGRHKFNLNRSWTMAKIAASYAGPSPCPLAPDLHLDELHPGSEVGQPRRVVPGSGSGQRFFIHYCLEYRRILIFFCNKLHGAGCTTGFSS